MTLLSRRTLMLGAISGLPGCSALSTLGTASEPLDTYDLAPAAGSQAGRRTARTLLVALPQASAALATDRIMVKPDPVAITYLPDARWSDALPAVLQTLLVRSIAQTGRIGYVGRSDAGPVPDKALLVRIDAFEGAAQGDGTFEIRVDVDLTLINDRDQRVVASRRFSQTNALNSDDTNAIVAEFQTVLNALLPAMSDWAIARV